MLNYQHQEIKKGAGGHLIRESQKYLVSLQVQSGGGIRLLRLFTNSMNLIKTSLEEFLNARLEGTGYFLVSVAFCADDRIEVEIDGMSPVGIDFCVELSRAVEEAFAPEIDDYDFELGSAGLTSPFKVIGQYRKNVGNKIEVLTADGRKLRGVLESVDEEGVILGIEEKVKKEGMKRPVVEIVELPLKFENINTAKYLLEF